MKTLFALVVFVSAWNAVQAQEIELTGAYQFNRIEAGAFGFSGSTTFPAGASANINVPVGQWLGVTGDLGWTQKSLSTSGITATARLFTYGAGPQFTYRKDAKMQPFLRMIFGAGTVTGSASQIGSATSTAFMFGPGGGLDARVSPHVWIRAGVDYLHGDKQGVSVNDLRAIAGIQFRFGGRTTYISPDNQSRRSVSPANNSSRPTLSTSGSPIVIASLGLSASAQKDGAEVTEILSTGLAAHCGLHVGDVINLVNDKRVRTPTELSAEISAKKPGEIIEIGYLIGGLWQAKATLAVPVP